MLSKFLNPLKSVDDVMQVFNRTIAELEEVAQTHTGLAHRHAEAAQASMVAFHASVHEASRASIVIAKLKALLGSEEQAEEVKVVEGEVVEGASA